MSLVPHHFLFRLVHPCPFVDGVPCTEGDDLLDLPDPCRIEPFADLDVRKVFAEVRLGWNDHGLAVQLDVRGKEQGPLGDVRRPRSSDGMTLWLDTRYARTSHRASRFCHQFHLLAAGGGPERDEPAFAQTRINRALQDAPLADAGEVLLRRQMRRGGYRLEAFLPATALHGFDPAQNPRLGVYWLVHDQELGDQVLTVGGEFPFAEDPSLWSALELVREK